MRHAVVLAMCVSISPVAAQSVMDGSDNGLDRALVLAAFRSLTESSNDPYSVQLDRLQLSQAVDGSRSLCGFVNKPDMQGRYGGFNPFAYSEAKNQSAVLPAKNVSAELTELYRLIFKHVGCERLLPVENSPATVRSTPPTPAASTLE